MPNYHRLWWISAPAVVVFLGIGGGLDTLGAPLGVSAGVAAMVAIALLVALIWRFGR